MNSLHISSVTEMPTMSRSFQLNSHRIWSRDGAMGGLLVEDKKRPKSSLMCCATEKECGRRERVAKRLDSVSEGGFSCMNVSQGDEKLLTRQLLEWKDCNYALISDLIPNEFM